MPLNSAPSLPLPPPSSAAVALPLLLPPPLLPRPRARPPQEYAPATPSITAKLAALSPSAALISAAAAAASGTGDIGGKGGELGMGEGEALLEGMGEGEALSAGGGVSPRSTSPEGSLQETARYHERNGFGVLPGR